MDQGIAALVGALIGGGISLLTTWGVEFRRDHRQARNLAVAAASELDAILMMVEARKWKESFAEARDLAESGTVFQISIHTKDEYLPMCRAAMACAGSIDHDLAIYLGRVLTLADALISDIKRLATYPLDSAEGLLSKGDPQGAAELYSTMVDIIDAAVHTESAAISRVALVYPKPEPKFLDRCGAAWRALWAH